jgi:hypothetical protein
MDDLQMNKKNILRRKEREQQQYFSITLHIGCHEKRKKANAIMRVPLITATTSESYKN